MKVTPVACLTDNYAYLVTCEETGETAVVDPSEAAPVLAALGTAGVRLSAIWCTHHHPDHVGGNLEVSAATSVTRIVGHDSDFGRIPGQTVRLRGGDEFFLGKIRVRAWHVPGHTRGAVAYVLYDEGDRATAAFTGDTLFLGGCGRLFEGTASDMHHSLSVLASLGDDTLIYPGHEYTVANLRFAGLLTPADEVLQTRLSWATQMRERGMPTVPGKLRDELRTNPFLRVAEPGIRAALSIDDAEDDVEVFAKLRTAKDQGRVAR